MDPDVGDLVAGDVLIEDSTIRDVGPDLGTDGEVIDCSGSIVIPGFVNSHIHMFQTALRGYWTDALAPDYFAQSREGPDAIFHKYTSDDVYIGEYAGALECLNAGVTTAVDTSQCSYTPAHTDAAIRGLQDSGLRAVYVYSPTTGDNIPAPDYAYPQDLHRLKDALAGDGLVTLALHSPMDADNWALAREVGVPIFTHVNYTKGGLGLEELGRAGVMGSDTTYIHCTWLEDSTWRWIAETGGKVSLSIIVEQTLQHGFAGLQPALDHGLRPSLGTDAVSMGPTDLFAQMKAAFALQRSRIQEAGARGENDLPSVVSTRDILEMATIGGAHAAHLADVTGSLTPGKEADVVVLRADRLNAAPLNSATGAVVTLLDTSNVWTVLVGGNVVKYQGSLVDVSVPDVIRRVRDSADGLFARSGYPRDVLGTRNRR
ncbi:cytosine deaminase [Mycolicibacterium agri]|nr:amidohydrolase family protein [Mycolicibacterium agri]PEG35183.1 cytosine deaminase [Mycolicibacterium agri]